ncbi:hypothetical protein Esi_0577_0005 [Ectocarpus siliculosus]|uniref:Uncharacterized protein n=1 Tax=Ectocarpus siliculosus TaxID=2880 RepID=D7G4P5_ECTSI|nr:hypothetical protein Esi_0577_0005 [Ectocarpus siliculosus]|eukprot:CBJ33732.1 hypothetical protein Esi_0577_0005 [Ectocarpus siliculosus]
MAAWNEVHHLNVTDLLFALGLREGRPRGGSGTEGGKSRKAEDRRGEAGLEGGDGAVDRHQPVQPCKADSCLEREDRMEKLLEKRAALQEASIRARRRQAAASARSTASEASRDDKTEEDRLVSMKTHYAALEEVLHHLSADKARHKREEAVDSMPAHLRRSLPSGLAEARRGLNFCVPPSRATRSTGRLETVFAILEDGMPGGRLETRGESVHGLSARQQGAASAPSLSFDEDSIAVWPTTPPRRRLQTGAKFPPLQLTVSPIRCASVGGVATLDEDEIGVRRDKQKARLRRRAREWWKAAGSIDDGERGGTGHHRPDPSRGHPGGGGWRDWRSVTACDADAGVDRRRSAWSFPVSGASVSPSRSTPFASPPPLRRVAVHK